MASLPGCMPRLETVNIVFDSHMQPTSGPDIRPEADRALMNLPGLRSVHFSVRSWPHDHSLDDTYWLHYLKKARPIHYICIPGLHFRVQPRIAAYGGSLQSDTWLSYNFPMASAAGLLTISERNAEEKQDPMDKIF